MVLVCQFVQPVLQKNDSILEFLSPEVNCCSSSQSLRTFIQLDNMEEELRNFDYHANPTFDKLYKDKITETGIIIVNVGRTLHWIRGLLVCPSC